MYVLPVCTMYYLWGTYIPSHQKYIHSKPRRAAPSTPSSSPSLDTDLPIPHLLLLPTNYLESLEPWRARTASSQRPLSTLGLQTLPSRERADLRLGQNSTHATKYTTYNHQGQDTWNSVPTSPGCPGPCLRPQTRLLSLEIEICFELATRPPAALSTFQPGRDFSFLQHLHIHKQPHNTYNSAVLHTLV